MGGKANYIIRVIYKHFRSSAVFTQRDAPKLASLARKQETEAMTKTNSNPVELAHAITSILYIERRIARPTKTIYKSLISALKVLGLEGRDAQPVLVYMAYHNTDGTPRKGLT